MMELSADDLKSLKTYIRIDFNDDDKLLQEFAAAAAADMERMGIQYQPDDPAWKMVLFAIVLDWYENRGNVGTIPAIAEGMIFRLKTSNPDNYGGGME